MWWSICASVNSSTQRLFDLVTAAVFDEALRQAVDEHTFVRDVTRLAERLQKLVNLKETRDVHDMQVTAQNMALPAPIRT